MMKKKKLHRSKPWTMALSIAMIAMFGLMFTIGCSESPEGTSSSGGGGTDDTTDYGTVEADFQLPNYSGNLDTLALYGIETEESKVELNPATPTKRQPIVVNIYEDVNDPSTYMGEYRLAPGVAPNPLYHVVVDDPNPPPTVQKEIQSAGASEIGILALDPLPAANPVIIGDAAAKGCYDISCGVDWSLYFNPLTNSFFNPNWRIAKWQFLTLSACSYGDCHSTNLNVGGANLDNAQMSIGSTVSYDQRAFACLWAYEDNNTTAVEALTDYEGTVVCQETAMFVRIWVNGDDVNDIYDVFGAPFDGSTDEHVYVESPQINGGAFSEMAWDVGANAYTHTVSVTNETYWRVVLLSPYQGPIIPLQGTLEPILGGARLQRLNNFGAVVLENPLTNIYDVAPALNVFWPTYLIPGGINQPADTRDAPAPWT